MMGAMDRRRFDVPALGGPVVLRAAGRRGIGLTTHRRWSGAALGVVGLAVLTAVFRSSGAEVELSTALLSYLALTVVVAAVGGIWPSVVVAVVGFAASNWFVTPPFRTWVVHSVQDVLALAVFLTTAVVISALVDLAARRATEAERAGAEAKALARLAATVAASDDPLDRLVDDLRRVFQLEAAAVLRREDGRWIVLACAGSPCPRSPAEGSDTLELQPGGVLVLRGPHAPLDDRRVLAAFAAQLALALERQRLEAEAVRAEGLAEADRFRISLLSAVSHDLRTPLATIKAWLTGVLDEDAAFDLDEVHEIIGAAVSEVDRLNALVGNLLDLSRLQSGALYVHAQPVELDAVAAEAVAGLGSASHHVDLHLADTLPPVLADAALLERVLANLIDNAVRHAPDAQPCEVRAVTVGDRMDVRIIDHGPGIPADQRASAFEPFQRLDDHTGGLGLGLAAARGLTEALSAELSIEDTPGGGATMVLRLKIAS